MSETNTLTFTEFKPTPIIKKLSKSKSIEGLNIVSEQPDEETVKKARGRKCKYANDEERKEARRKQQREYRLRKKHELELLRKYAEEHLNDNGEGILYKVMEEHLNDEEEALNDLPNEDDSIHQEDCDSSRKE